jgi:hypothetical protein
LQSSLGSPRPLEIRRGGGEDCGGAAPTGWGAGRIPAPTQEVSVFSRPLPHRIALGLVIGLAACHAPARTRTRAVTDSVASGSLDSPTAQPPVVRQSTVVAFWLQASDTLKAGEGAELLDDFRAYTAMVAPYLAAQHIDLVATTASSIIVELEGGPRRVIMLPGLDFPFGYAMVEPGYAELLLTGVSTDDELMDQVDWYFGVDDEEGDSAQQVGRGDAGGTAGRTRGALVAAGRARFADYHFPQTRHQRAGRERLLQEGRIRQQDAVLQDGVVGVAGDVQHSQAGPLQQHPLGQLLAAHARHDDVGDHGVDVP